MAFITKKIVLNKEWQLLLDNTGNGDAKANSNNSFYANVGSAEFAYSDDTPTIENGMRISAGARIIPVPVGAKLWGRLTHYCDYDDYCEVHVNYEEN